MMCSTSSSERVRLLAGMASALLKSSGSAAATAGAPNIPKNVRRSTVPMANPPNVATRNQPPDPIDGTLPQRDRRSIFRRCLGDLHEADPAEGVPARPPAARADPGPLVTWSPSGPGRQAPGLAGAGVRADRLRQPPGRDDE